MREFSTNDAGDEFPRVYIFFYSHTPHIAYNYVDVYQPGKKEYYLIK